MKKLELNQMKTLEGGGPGFGTAFACGTFLITLGVLSGATGGLALAIAAPLSSMACGVALGHGLNTNNWW